jgi:hypothetical protein
MNVVNPQYGHPTLVYDASVIQPTSSACCSRARGMGIGDWLAPRDYGNAHILRYANRFEGGRVDTIQCFVGTLVLDEQVSTAEFRVRPSLRGACSD